MKQRPNPSTKPYYRCLSCSRFRDSCVGIPTRDMDMQNWCEYVRDVMEAYHLTCDYVSEKADVSKKTIERIRAINIDQDIMRATARRIEIVVFGAVAHHICCIDYEENKASDKIAALEAQITALREDVTYWRKENDRKAKIIDLYLEEHKK